MSDFDEEAERERLRERFEREERKREATERMSELLLKGATMTNAHCSDCGDPIFRYDGQEFCASCQKPVDRGDDEDEAADADDDGDEAGDDTATVEVTSPSDDARVRFGGDDAPDTTADEDASTEDTRRQTPSDDLAGDEGGDRSADRTGPAVTSPPSDDVGAAIGSARADLAATLQRFARAARQSESPAAAKAHLEAARVAAETLDELD